MIKIKKTAYIITLMACVFPFYAFAEKDPGTCSYRFLTEARWTGKNRYTDADFVFEFMDFKKKPGSKLYKVRRERNIIYLVEIHDNREYFPDASGDRGRKIIQLDSYKYQVENTVILDNGTAVDAPMTLFRQKNILLENTADYLTGDWAFLSDTGDLHEYRPVCGDFQYLIYIPDYDWYSGYAEEGWHYLRYTGNGIFETDRAFSNASFRLTVETGNTLVLAPLFKKHDNTDGVIMLERKQGKQQID